MGLHMCGHTHAMEVRGQTVGVCSLYHVGPRDSAQVVRLGSKCPEPHETSLHSGLLFFVICLRWATLGLVVRALVWFSFGI